MKTNPRHLRLVPTEPAAAGNPTTCDHYAALLPIFADEGLSDDQTRSIAAHVRDCPACALEVQQFRAILMGVRDMGQQDRPQLSPGQWRAMEAEIMLRIEHLPQGRSWRAHPALRWAGGLALAATLIALAATPVRQWLGDGPMQAEEAVDSRALLGSAKEAVAPDRAFVDDLAASDDDPLGMVDELEDLEDIDLDALGTALDDEAVNGQGA